jgi:hypothetical protein
MRTVAIAICLLAAACGSDSGPIGDDDVPPGPDLATCTSWTATGTTDVTTADGSSSMFPSVVALDDGYGVAWYDERTPHGAYYARLDATGARTGADVALATGPVVGNPQIAWNGQELGATWEDFRDSLPVVDAGRFTADGAPITARIPVSMSTQYSNRPAIAATADGWAVTWVEADTGTEGDEDIWLGRIAPDGTAGLPIQITDAPGSQYAPAVAASPDDIRLAWHDMRAGEADIYTASTLDVSIATPLEVTDSDSLVPSIAHGNDGWGIGYHDSRTGGWQTYFARTDVAGTMLGETRLSIDDAYYANFPRVIAVGDVWVAVWQEVRGVEDARIVAVRVGADGAIIGDRVVVANVVEVNAPAITASATGDIGIAWQEVSPAVEVRFARIVCAE